MTLTVTIRGLIWGVIGGAYWTPNGNTTICQYYKLSEYIFVSEIFVNIPNVILSNVIAKELSKVCILMIIAISSKIFILNLSP